MESRIRSVAIIVIGLALVGTLACSSGRGPEEAASGEPEKLSTLCGEGVGTSSHGEIGWLDADATDVTPRFRELLERVRAGEDVVPPEAVDYVWLLVPGLFSDLYPGYMKGNVKALREHGLRWREVNLTPDQSVTSGAQMLRDIVLAETAEGQQAVILSHSKGGVDAAAALALYPEIRSRVRSFVAVQVPYAGSPVASDLAHCPKLGDSAAFLIKLFGDSPEAADELSYVTRRDFIAKHPHPRTVPTLSLATSRVDWRSIVGMTGRYVLSKYGVMSDGLVVPVDAVLPGSQAIHLDDMDHAEAVLAGVPGFVNYHAREVTEVLVAMAVDL